MIRTADQSSISAINRRAIINQLKNNSDMSKAQLAKNLGISKPAIADNVNNLIEQNFILELGIGDSTASGGRRPMILSFNARCKLIIAIDLHKETPLCALGDLRANMIDCQPISVPSQSSSEKRLAAVQECIDSMLRKHKLKISKIGRIVISTPGIISKSLDRYYSQPQFQSWTQINLESFLVSRYPVPVMINNDVNLAVLGEKAIGVGKEFKNLAFVSCGLGLGAGLILDGKLYSGKRFAAGEVGYCTDYEHFLKDQTLEDLVSVHSLLNTIRIDISAKRAGSFFASFFDDPQRLQMSDLVTAYELEDQYCFEKMFLIGKRLGMLLLNMSAILDLDMVVIGGEYLPFETVLLDGIFSILAKSKLSSPVIKMSSLNDEATIFGCFVLASEAILDFE